MKQQFLVNVENDEYVDPTAIEMGITYLLRDAIVKVYENRGAKIDVDKY